MSQRQNQPLKEDIKTYRHEGGYVEKTLDITSYVLDRTDVLTAMRLVAKKNKSSIDALLVFSITDREDIEVIKDSPKATLRTYKGRKTAEFTESSSWDDRASLAKWITGLASSWASTKRKLIYAQVGGLEGD